MLTIQLKLGVILIVKSLSKVLTKFVFKGDIYAVSDLGKTLIICFFLED